MISFLSFSLVFADSTDASTDAAATLNLRLKRLLNYASWVWIWLSKIAWWCLGNSAVFGEFFGLDGVLWNLRNIMKNIANFGIGFLFLFKIIKTLFKAEEAFSFSFFKSFLVSGVLIQISRFFCATMIDISTVSIAWIGWLSTQLLNQDDVLSRSFEKSTLHDLIYNEDWTYKTIVVKTDDNGQTEVSVVNLLKDKGIVKKELTEKEILDSFLPSRDNFSGPLTFIGLSLYDIQNSKFDNKYGVNDADTQNNFTTLINLMFNGVLGILCYTITLFFMVIIAFLRIFLLWMFIILSPLLILINQFEKELSWIGESVKMFSIKNFFKLVFRPVIVCLWLSILEFISATIDNIVPKSWSITLNELSCDNDSCTVGDIFDFHVLGLSSPLWQVFFSIIKIIILRKIIKMSITFETGFQTIDNITKKGTDLIEDWALTQPIVPFAQHGLSINTIKKDILWENGYFRRQWRQAIENLETNHRDDMNNWLNWIFGKEQDFQYWKIQPKLNTAKPWEYANVFEGYKEDNNPKHNISFTRSNGSFMTYFTQWLDAYTERNRKQTDNPLILYYNAWKDTYSWKNPPTDFIAHLRDKTILNKSFWNPATNIEAVREQIANERWFKKDWWEADKPYHK